MQQRVKRVQKMLNENVMIMTSKDLNLNVTTQNFISTEFYHIGIKDPIAYSFDEHSTLSMCKS